MHFLSDMIPAMINYFPIDAGFIASHTGCLTGRSAHVITGTHLIQTIGDTNGHDAN